ncbi:MAG: hypothetical protein WBX00_16545 [Isosphaeraceae bacterium]
MMSTTSVRLGSLVAPHCVRYASFPMADFEAQRLIMQGWAGRAGRWDWDGRTVHESTDADRFPRAQPDTFVALYQARLETACTLESAARFCHEVAARCPWPEKLGPALGETAVLLARVEPPVADRATEAEALLATLTGGRPAAVVGGPIGPGVALWAPTDDPTWLILLCDDDEDERAEDAAARRLYGALWLAETCDHKIRYQARDIEPETDILKGLLKTLQESLDRLAESLDVPLRIDPDAEALTKTVARNAATTRARHDVTDATGRLRMIATTIEANRANLVAYRDLLGDGHGRAALDGRLRDANRNLAQIQTELGYSEPLERAVDGATALLQTRLMTAMSLTEMAEDRRRQREADRRDENNFMLTLLLVWIGLSQTFAAFVTTFFPEPHRDLGIKTAILFSPTIIMGLWFGGWRLKRWLDRRSSAGVRS